MKRRVSVIIASLVFVLSGCAPWVMTSSEKEFKDSPRGFTAQLPDGWMRFALGNDFLMTRDGVALNRIGVRKLKFKNKLEYTKKMFEPQMMPMDLADVEIDNLKSDNAISQLVILENIPLTISGQDAFKLTFSYETLSGLKIKGILCGFIYKERVYLILFDAPVQHYYSRDYPAFENFLNTFKLI